MTREPISWTEEHIRKQHAEIERLKAALGPGATEAWEHMYAEIERLKAALQQIVQRYETAEDGWPAEDMRTIAEGALEPKP